MKIGIFLDHLKDAVRQTGLPLETVALEAVKAGISFVHVNGMFWMENESQVDELMEKTGLHVGSSDEFLHLTQGKDIEKAEKLIRFLARKGVGQLLLIPGFVHETQTKQAAMEEAAKHMKALVQLAQNLQVQCSLEDYDNSAAPFGTWQELKWYTEQVPDLSISFDTGNFAYFGQDAMEAYQQLKDKICLVHAKDRKYEGRKGEQPLKTTDGKPLYPSAVGSGEMPMQAILNDLKARGYQGGVLIEHFGSADMMADMKQSAKWLQPYID